MASVFVEHQESSDYKLTRQMIVSMTFAVFFGCIYHETFLRIPEAVEFIDLYVVNGVFELIGQYFLRALKMVVVPLVFFSLISGIASERDPQDGAHSGVDGLGGRAAWTFGLYIGTTVCAVALALFLASLVDPGVGVPIASELNYSPPEGRSVIDVLVTFVPTNIVGAFASGNMLAVIFVSLAFGLAMNVSGQAGFRVGQFCRDANVVTIKLIFLIMKFAPLGVFCLVFEVFADQGVHFITRIASYFFTVVLALFLHLVIVYNGLLILVARVSPLIFWKKMHQVMLFAFSTASSAATIGVNMRNAIERLGVNSHIAALTIPLGATINMDGTAIMQGVAVVFIAGVYGIDLTMMQYLEVIALATLASIGTAAVPSAGLVTLAVVLTQVNLPAEAIGLIIGVDRLLDMLRTAVNVAGDAAISVVVAHKEQGIARDIYASELN